MIFVCNIFPLSIYFIYCEFLHINIHLLYFQFNVRNDFCREKRRISIFTSFRCHFYSYLFLSKLDKKKKSVRDITRALFENPMADGAVPDLYDSLLLIPLLLIDTGRLAFYSQYLTPRLAISDVFNESIARYFTSGASDKCQPKCKF